MSLLLPLSEVPHDASTTHIAYFSMEIALEPEIPTYSGGLGVLAGDILHSAADMEIPMVGVTLVHHNGYFRQKIDPQEINWKKQTHGILIDIWKLLTIGRPY